MTDYISREEVLKAIQPRYAPAVNKALAAIISSVPAADVVERESATWLDSEIPYCSRCGYDALEHLRSNSEGHPAWKYCKSNYCPYCGAKMVD